MKKSRLDYEFFVYIMASISGVLYVGVTNDIVKRVWQHKNDIKDGFTKKYQCHKLVYYEEYQYINDAIHREKQLKKWNRAKKEFLIKRNNSYFNDKARDWYKPAVCPPLLRRTGRSKRIIN